MKGILDVKMSKICPVSSSNKNTRQHRHMPFQYNTIVVCLQKDASITHTVGDNPIWSGDRERHPLGELGDQRKKVANRPELETGESASCEQKLWEIPGRLCRGPVVDKTAQW